MIGSAFLYCLYDNTHQSALAVIDNLLHGILELYLALIPDLYQLGMDPVFHQLSDRFSEYIGLPDAFFSSQKRLSS